MAESSEDSELAAMLDENLFPDDDTDQQEQAYEEDYVDDAADGDGTAAAVAEDSSYPEDEQPEQQVAKRPRTLATENNVDALGAASEQQQAAEAICPPHPGWWMNMCMRCGAHKPEETDAAAPGGAADAAGSNGGRALTKIKHLHHRQALEVGCRVSAMPYCWNAEAVLLHSMHSMAVHGSGSP
jgi:hypothetical protein